MAFNRRRLIREWWNKANADADEFDMSFSIDEVIRKKIDKSQDDENEKRRLLARTLERYTLPPDLDMATFYNLLLFAKIAAKASGTNCEPESIAGFLTAYFNDAEKAIDYLEWCESDYLQSSDDSRLNRFFEDALVFGREYVQRNDKWKAENQFERALEQKKEGSVKLLVDYYRADVNAILHTRVGKSQWHGLPETLIHVYAFEGNLHMVEMLFDKGADVGKINSCGRLVQHLAAESGNLDLLKWLRIHNLNMDSMLSYDDESVLYCAFLSGRFNFDMVRWLVEEQKVNVNVETKRHETVLHLAAAYQSVEVVKYLVQHGARDSVNVREKSHGCYSVQLASQKGKWDNVIYLMPFQSDKNVKDRHGKSILHYAVESASPDIIRQLVELGANVNIADNNGKTPLHYAVELGKWDMVEMLVTVCDANRDVVDKSGHKPMHYCAGHVGNTLPARLHSLFSSNPTLFSVKLDQEEAAMAQIMAALKEGDFFSTKHAYRFDRKAEDIVPIHELAEAESYKRSRFLRNLLKAKNNVISEGIIEGLDALLHRKVQFSKILELDEDKQYILLCDSLTSLLVSAGVEFDKLSNILCSQITELYEMLHGDKEKMIMLCLSEKSSKVADEVIRYIDEVRLDEKSSRIRSNRF